MNLSLRAANLELRVKCEVLIDIYFRRAIARPHSAGRPLITPLAIHFAVAAKHINAVVRRRGANLQEGPDIQRTEAVKWCERYRAHHVTQIQHEGHGTIMPKQCLPRAALERRRGYYAAVER